MTNPDQKTLGTLEQDVRDATDRHDPADLEPLHDVFDAAMAEPHVVLYPDARWPLDPEGLRTTWVTPVQHAAMRVKLGLDPA